MSDQPRTVPMHGPWETDVISDELTACVLGQRERPELRMDPTGRMLHAIRSGLVHIAPRIDRLMAELRTYRYPTA